ncbi:MAG: ribonuclease III [Oscillospiraceae bacterium]|nr:ribonuclease III [Oscillospiraceae bacterium]
MTDKPDFLSLELPPERIKSVSSLGLAHIGDCVWELMVRSWLLWSGKATAVGLHRATVAHVSASAQAKAVDIMLPSLTEEELAVFRRGRNAHVNTVPKNAKLSDYHAATGLETLWGWLYLNGRRERLGELFAMIIGEDTDAT